MVATSATIMSITHDGLQTRSRLLCLTGPSQGKQYLHIGFPLTEGRLGAIADHENFFMLGRGKRLVVRKEFLPCAVSAGTFGSTLR
ncbi:MAG: hypothetical protein COW33_05940 [Anaerolineae bacterium CG17_big_fil_post_rev_8_21_14_2_50_57_27]|nr:MAG: hypothetical protein COS63_00780 [Anaerolineae bacterium CG06_land_8_20_14_3_00_57_67]PIW18173.1 MAG: hypothetical protein COW33_05940 [Anaerolineae bacterium CG17_big_fil_post_rev_8_21_14_2_50_57_27]